MNVDFISTTQNMQHIFKVHPFFDQWTDTYAYATINGNCLLVRFQLLVLATDRHIRDHKWKLSACPVSAIGVGNGQTHTRTRQ